MGKESTSVLLPRAGDPTEIGTAAKSDANNAHHHVISLLGVNAQGNAVRVSVTADKGSGKLYLTATGARWLGVQLLMRSTPDELVNDKDFMTLYRMARVLVEKAE